MYIEENNIKKVNDDTSEIINFLKNIEGSDLDQRLDQLCNMVKMAQSIIFLGIGSSGILCKYAARYFSSIGKFTVHIDDPFFPKNFTRFKKENCTIASITNTENCTIAKISDLNLPYYVQQVKVNYSDITTQIPVLYMIERIGKKLYNEYGIE